MHGDQVGADPLADIIGTQGAALDKHVHFPAVAEGFMGDQAGDFRAGDDFIFPGNDPLRGNQVLRDPEHFGDRVFHGVKQFRTETLANFLGQ